MKRWLKRPSVVAMLIALVVYGIVSLVQSLGFLEKWELQVYDIMLRARHDPKVNDPRIVLVGIDEDDIHWKDYPVRDGLMAKLLDKILKAEPCAVGVDIYRDLPEPRDGSERKPLAELFDREEKLVVIYNLPGPDLVQPPPELMGPESEFNIAFNDSFPPDSRGMVRRLLLEATLNNEKGEPEFKYALSFNLAMRYVAVEAAKRGLDGTPHFLGSSFKLGKATFSKLHPNDGGYHHLDAGGIQIMMDFKSPALFDTYSMRDVIEGKIPATVFRDRIVLVGTTCPSIKDYLTTPLKGDQEQYGVAIHAQAVNQLLRAALDGDPTTRVLSQWQQRVWSFLWAVLGGGVGYALFRWPKASVLAIFGGAAALVGVTWIAFLKIWWLPAVDPALNYSLAALGTFAFVHVLERRQRSELMQIFSRHVSEEVAKHIWAERETFMDGNRPRSRKVTATVLFTDFVGFSSVSEKIGDPSVLMEWLNNGMEHLTQEVLVRDGIVNKYIGDAIMAVFGVPVPRRTEEELSTDATNAVRCALAMGATLEKLNAQWRVEGRHEIGMRIGIYTGSLVVGYMGSAKRLEFTVIGDTVNTASRLESTGKDEILPPPGSCCRILIGESTHKLLGDRFETEYVGEEHLKGKANTVSVYRVVREKQPSLASSNPLSV